MRAMLFLLRRCLFPNRGSLLTFALWVSVAGVALGIVQLMLVLSVMSGFQKVFADCYTRISSELTIIPRGKRYDESFKKEILAVPGIAAVTPTEIGQGMVMAGNAVGGVIFEGIDYESSRQVTPWDSLWVERPDFEAQGAGPDWVWLGNQLAAKLQVHRGDTVNVLIADEAGKRIVPFRVTGITRFGIYDYDLRHAYLALPTLIRLFHRQDQEPIYKTKLTAGANAEWIQEKLRDKLGRGVSVRLWSDMNQNIFLAVQHQKKMLFLMLEIIVALAAMNVVNLLMMSSHQRRRDVAILRAMGMGLSKIIFFFVAQGAAVGAAGITLGVALGYLVCAIVARFQPALLSESIYNVTRLPVRVELFDVGMICTAGFVLCVLFSLIPALGAAMSRPVNALRYE